MITYNSNSSKFTATLSGYPTADPSFDGVLYTASKTMLRLVRNDEQKLTGYTIKVTPSPDKSLAYFSDPQGVLEIPIKNIVNANAAGGSLTIEIKMQDIFGFTVVDQSSKDFAVLPGVAELDACIPVKVDADPFTVSPPCVMPPNVIVNPLMLRGGSAPGTIVEAGIQNRGVGYTWETFAAGVGTTVTPSGDRDNQIEIPATADTLVLTNGATTKKWPLEKPDDCTDLVCIRWTSLTGAVRQHYFPIVAFTTGNDKSVSLVNPGDGYDVRKKSFLGCVCRLTGLTTYGYWYYMDLLRASDVHAILGASSIPWVPVVQEAAFVEGNAAATPQGVGFHNFEFNIKMKHYDTL